MQNRGAISFIAIVMAIACIYQLSFTFKANQIRSKAEDYSRGSIIREAYFLDSVSGETVFNMGIRKFTFMECMQREMNLGLDLKGGMSVILEVAVVDILNSLTLNPSDSIFQASIALAQEMQKNSQEEFVILFGRAFEKLVPGGKLAQYFYSNPSLRGMIDFNSTNEQVIEVLSREADDAIDNSFNILYNRIDKFGVAQPNIQKLGKQGRIMVELPGIKDPERVRNLLQTTANLEFWETYDNGELYQALLDANKAVKRINEAIADTIAASGDSATAALTDTAIKDTTAGSELSLLDQIEKADTANTDTTAGKESAKDYPLFALLYPSVSNDGKLLPGSVIGRAHQKDIKKINELLSHKQVAASFPKDLRFYWSSKPPRYDNSKTIYELHAIKVTGRDGKAPLDGSVIVNARPEFSQTRASAEVTMNMNGEGAKIWARMTRENVGKCIAIMLDNKVYSSPRVQQEITGGNSQITGDFSVDEAKDLANVLKSGKLPAPARIIQEAVIGPSLGKESINDGFNSFVAAFIVVCFFMVLYYSRSAGLVADLALFTNIFFIVGIMASLNAVLTLPGIAGIVLTIGMSVDANVLIYERIREEIAVGKGIRMAIKDGYKNALSAIIDGNVTTLLTGIILYTFGTGPIRGFATTLIIGIITTLFATIYISRLVFEFMLDKNRNLTFSTFMSARAFKNLDFKILQSRHIGYIISTVILVVGLGSLVTRGLNLGVDFTGGRTYIVRFDQNVRTDEVRSALLSQFGEAPAVIIFGSDNQVRITTKYKINEKGSDVDQEVETKIFEGLKPLLPSGVTFDKFVTDHVLQSEKIGPTIADDIKKDAFWAVLFSLIVIFVYVLIRFKKWQLSLGAILSLAHDAFMVIFLFSLFNGILPFSLEADQSFVAAVLTIIGYSVNDTVVIFDRIREYEALYPKRPIRELYNMALNSTLSRTFVTSFTVFLVLVVTFLFGGETIRGFSFAMLIGVVSGTYSTLYIAVPVAYEFLLRKKENIAVQETKS